MNFKNHIINALETKNIVLINQLLINNNFINNTLSSVISDIEKILFDISNIDKIKPSKNTYYCKNLNFNNKHLIEKYQTILYYLIFINSISIHSTYYNPDNIILSSKEQNEIFNFVLSL